jgi:hypothetical protein
LCADEEEASIPRRKAEELLGVITAWAEANHYGIGGGFRLPDDSDYREFPIDEDGSSARELEEDD